MIRCKGCEGREERHLMKIFALEHSREWGEKISASLEVELAAHEEREFEDGEHKARPLENVRGRDLFVIHSLFEEPGQSVNDKVCRLLFFIGALKDASAAKVTAVIPYFAYARKDRKTKPRDPVTIRYMARLLEAAGADHIVTMDIHNVAAFQNAFRISSDHLESSSIFAPYFASRLKDKEVVVVSPDSGGAKRAEKFRKAYSELTGKIVGVAFMDKSRAAGGITGGTVVGNVRGKAALIIDDIISSGSTMAQAVSTLKDQGAGEIYAAAAHGIFIGSAHKLLDNPNLDGLALTNTVKPFRLKKTDKIEFLDATELFAQAIARIHRGGSVVELLAQYSRRQI